MTSCTFRYQQLLRRAKKVGYKKSLFASLVNGLVQAVLFGTFAIGFW